MKLAPKSLVRHLLLVAGAAGLFALTACEPEEQPAEEVPPLEETTPAPMTPAE